jgi:hypothetical protein
MPFNANYDIGMNGGNPGASQWFKLNIAVNEDGGILIHNTLDNDTLQGWSGSYRFEFHDVRDNTLLFYIDSPEYSIGAKPPGPHVMQQAPDLTLSVDSGLAQRFIAYPSMYGVKSAYEEGDWFFDGSGALAEQIGEAIITAVAAG